MKCIRTAATALLVAALSTSFAATASAQVVAPVPFQGRGDCSSNHNLAHVHRRLDGAIDRLQHDRHDYGGHREGAIDDLQRARADLIAAERSAVGGAHDNPHCFGAGGPTGGSDRAWGMRGDRGSDRNLRVVSAWVERMIDELQRDNHDYGGHRVQAISEMQAARNELRAAAQYDSSTRR